MNEEYIATMENLIRSKKKNKKKSPTTDEKNDFKKAWTAYVSENGYPGKAEELLYQGFIFCGVGPFYQFLKQSGNQKEILNLLFSDEINGGNNETKFKIVTNLLALMMNEDVSIDLIEIMIKRFPSVCKNKEGEALKSAPKIMERCFLSVLSPAAVLPSLKKLNLNDGVIKDFLHVLNSIIEEIKQNGKNKEPAASNIIRLENWAKEYIENSAEEKNICPDGGNEVTNGNLGFNPGNLPAEAKREINNISLLSVLDQAKTLAKQLETEKSNLKNRIKELENGVQNNNLKLLKVEKKLEDERKTVSELRRQICELENQCRAQQKEIEDKDCVLREKNAEIATRIEHSEILSRDRSRQADESIQRISSKIRLEYLDYKDAIDAPMTVDLGENLRIQLQNIFNILEESGMKIE